MKKIISAACLACSLIANAKVITYPAPEGATLNDAFSVEVSSDGRAWMPVDVYQVKVNGGASVRNTSMAYLDCDSVAHVRVVSNSQRVKEARVRPLSYGIKPAVNGDTLTFSSLAGQTMSVEVNGDIFDNLQLFVNPIDKNAPSPKALKKLKKNKNYIYLGPGMHKIGNLRVESGQTVYVAGGAVVEGNIVVEDVRDVRVLGRGIIYPNKGGLKVVRSKNVEIDGLFATQCSVGGSDSVSITGVKVMSWFGWGDGFNVFASSNVRYEDIFARTSDDCHTIYCTRLGHYGSSNNVSMERAVLWADVAHPIMIGLHGSFDPATPDSVTHARYKNIDILDIRERQLDYQGALTINAGDNNLVKDIVFEDIRIEDFRLSRLFDIRIFYNKKYCKAPGRAIEDITFKDIVYNGNNSELSLIIGYDEEHMVRNILFDNLVINGVKITDDMPGKPKWYKTGDMARIFIGSHVENVVFK